MDHTRGKPYHPMTQEKIERWHRTMKDKVLLDNYYLPGDLKQRRGKLIINYNTRRYHESPNNLTPADVWLGKGCLKSTKQRPKTHLIFYAQSPKYSDDVQF